MSSLPLPFSESELGNGYSLEEAVESLTILKDWTQRYRQLFKLAAKIKPLQEQYKLEKHLVEGCESQVWMLHHFDRQHQKHYFIADSESKIIKGLLVLVLCSCSNKTTEELRTVNFEKLLKSLDFGKYLTPSRSNGLLSVIKKMQAFC